MKRIIALLLFIGIIPVFATPEFSLWTGSNCATCHVNKQGGGMRKEFGWTFGRDASLFSGRFGEEERVYGFDKQKYSKFDSIFTYGTDFRLETFRSHKTPDAVRRIVPMQASIYATLNPVSWLTFEGQYNIAKKVFDGQTFWSASAFIQPVNWLPALRIGRFQPSMGLRDCDMTSLDRRAPTPDGTEIIIAPDFSEYGAELVYNTYDWMQVTAGAFDSKSLHEVSSNGVFGFQSVVPVEHNPSFTTRFIIFPELLIENFPAMYFGASALVNGRFLYNNAFAGIGIFDNLHLYFKYAYSNTPYVRMTNAYIGGITYMPLKGILLGARFEHGISDWFLDNGSSKYQFTTDQAVLNAKIFVLPYIELIPEYRWINCKEYSSLRWALQLHIYY